MGCAWTKRQSRREDPSVIADQTCFTVREVEALHELFRKLSSSIIDDGFISKEEFQLGLFGNSKKQSLFADRIFDMFDIKHDGVIEFGEFIKSLSIFHPNTPQSEKIAFAFQLYDLRQTNYIGRDEFLVFQRTHTVAYGSISQTLLPRSVIVQAIIDKTFEEADLNGDGKIDMEEWKEFTSRNPTVLKNLTIPYLKDITTTFPSFILRSEDDDEIYGFS